MRRAWTIAVAAISVVILGSIAPSVVAQGESPVGAVPSPAASPTGDAELEALFPSEVGGEALSVTSMYATDPAAQSPDEMAQQFDTALAPHGKTFADVSLARAATSAASVDALRVRGADASAFAPDLIPIVFGMVPNAQQLPSTVAGKQVIRITNGPLPSTEDPTMRIVVVYPKDDVMWLVAALEPTLSEVLGKLP